MPLVAFYIKRSWQLLNFHLNFNVPSFTKATTSKIPCNLSLNSLTRTFATFHRTDWSSANSSYYLVWSCPALARVRFSRFLIWFRDVGFEPPENIVLINFGWFGDKLGRFARYVRSFDLDYTMAHVITDTRTYERTKTVKYIPSFQHLWFNRFVITEQTQILSELPFKCWLKDPFCLFLFEVWKVEAKMLLKLLLFGYYSFLKNQQCLIHKILAFSCSVS